MLQPWRNTIVPSSENLASIYQTFDPIKEYRYNDDDLTSINAQCDLNKKFVGKLVPDFGSGEKSRQHPKFPSFSDAISVQQDPSGV